MTSLDRWLDHLSAPVFVLLFALVIGGCIGLAAFIAFYREQNAKVTILEQKRKAWK